MKQSFLYSLLFLFFAISSCRKEDNPKLPDIVRVPTPLVLKADGSEQVISAQDPTSFNGKFTVDLFFKEDVPPQKFDVVIMKNGDKASVKTFKENITTFPITVEITGAQLATLFGTAVVVGDKFDVGIDVTTKEGQKFEAFPLVGNGVGSGVNSLPGASTAIRYEAVCNYNPDIYQGNFEVVEDEWADYKAGDIVVLTKIDDTHFSFEYPTPLNRQPIVVTVNPITNSVSVNKQVYGSYGNPPTWPYGDLSVESVASNDNFVAPCEQVFSVVLKHTVSAGSFGNNKIVLRKKS
jgi:hypothetical protein